jgi:anti-sigma B factor antagonist
VELSVEAAQAAVVVALKGDLDMASAPAVEDTVLGAIASRPDGGVALDLSQVDFLDSVGIRTLLVLARRARDAGVQFRLLRPTARTWRVLEMMLIPQVVPVEEHP